MQSLANNTLAKETSITIYSDAPRTEQDVPAVEDVRTYLDSVSGFKSVHIVKQESNQGLARSIIGGVSKSVQEFGRTIVLEDDMLTSPYFLKYMNEALNFYERDKKVMHVTGWNYPISAEGLDDGFLWRGMNCWGWGTWEDRWAHFTKDIPALHKQIPIWKRRQFNLSGRRRYWAEIAGNRTGQFDTWAVFWYATIYLRSGLCANPVHSLVRNIGLDGTGVNCQTGVDHLAGELSNNSQFKLQAAIEENPVALGRILDFYDRTRRPLLIRIGSRLKRLFKE